MQKCELTQRPCREAITETINANKSRHSLQRTYELAKLFQIAASENPNLTEEDWERYFIITKILMLDELRYLKFVDDFLRNLMK